MAAARPDYGWMRIAPGAWSRKPPKSGTLRLIFSLTIGKP